MEQFPGAQFYGKCTLRVYKIKGIFVTKALHPSLFIVHVRNVYVRFHPGCYQRDLFMDYLCTQVIHNTI